MKKLKYERKKLLNMVNMEDESVNVKFSKLNLLISYLPSEERNQIPEEIRKYISENVKEKYRFTINTSKDLEGQDIDDDVLIAFTYVSRYYTNSSLEKLDLKLCEKDYSLLNKIISVEKKIDAFNLLEYNKFIKYINELDISQNIKNKEEKLKEEKQRKKESENKEKVNETFSLILYKRNIFTILIDKIKRILFNKKFNDSKVF